MGADVICAGQKICYWLTPYAENPRYAVFLENRVTHLTGANMRKPGNWLKQRFEAAMGIIVALPAIPSAIIDHYAISHRQARDPIRQRKRPSETAISVLCLFLIMLVAMIDYRSATRASFALFYVLIAAYRRLEREPKGWPADRPGRFARRAYRRGRPRLTAGSAVLESRSADGNFVICRSVAVGGPQPDTSIWSSG